MALFETNIYYVLNTLQIVLFRILLEIYLYAYYNPVFDSWKTKNGCKACKINACSRFLFRSDMCYCAIFLHYGKFISFVCLMMLRIVDFLMNS